MSANNFPSGQPEEPADDIWLRHGNYEGGANDLLAVTDDVLKGRTALIKYGFTFPKFAPVTFTIVRQMPITLDAEGAERPVEDHLPERAGEFMDTKVHDAIDLYFHYEHPANDEGVVAYRDYGTGFRLRAAGGLLCGKAGAFEPYRAKIDPYDRASLPPQFGNKGAVDISADSALLVTRLMTALESVNDPRAYNKSLSKEVLSSLKNLSRQILWHESYDEGTSLEEMEALTQRIGTWATRNTVVKGRPLIEAQLQLPSDSTTRKPVVIQRDVLEFDALGLGVLQTISRKPSLNTSIFDYVLSYMRDGSVLKSSEPLKRRLASDAKDQVPHSHATEADIEQAMVDVQRGEELSA